MPATIAAANWHTQEKDKRKTKGTRRKELETETETEANYAKLVINVLKLRQPF